MPATGSLEVLSKAVASNAGTMGRQAAVIAVAGGLVVTLGVSGTAAEQKAAPAPADNNTSSLDIQRTAVTQVVSAKVTAKKFQASLPVVKVVAAPSEQAVAAPTKAATAEVTKVVEAPATTVSNSTSTRSTSSAAATRSNTSTSTASDSASDSSSKSSSAADSQPSANLSGLAATASSYAGAPYVLGGNTPSGWDCSGFVRWVYKQNGMNIDARTARGIWTGGQFVKTNNPKPGDIIIQRNGGHIAIYLGGDKYIGAQNPSAGTAFRSLSQVRDTFNGYYTWVG